MCRRDEWRKFFDWSEASIPGATPMTDEERGQLMAEMHEYLLSMTRARRGDPRDDLISVLANVEIDGEHLTDAELVMFLNQLLVAGNETTRNMVSGGMWALATNPDQWQRLVAVRSLVPTAVEEWLRWTTAVIAFMRTATADTVVGGVDVKAGDPLLLLYASANRDEDEFGPSADRFDVGRDPNHHVAFGFGAHFCIGAALARLEGRAARRAARPLLDRRARGRARAHAVGDHRRGALGTAPLRGGVGAGMEKVLYVLWGEPRCAGTSCATPCWAGSPALLKVRARPASR